MEHAALHHSGLLQREMHVVEIHIEDMYVYTMYVCIFLYMSCKSNTKIYKISFYWL